MATFRLRALAVIGYFLATGLVNAAASRRKSMESRGPVLSKYMHLRVSDGWGFIDSNDMGVKYCKLIMDGAAFGSDIGYPSLFTLHVFVKLTSYDGITRIKGSASVQPILPTAPSRKQDQLFDPGLQIFTRDNRTSFPLAGQARFPFSQSSRASTSPLTATFEVPASNGHSYYLTSPFSSSSCHLNAPYEPNVIDYRGFKVADVGRDQKKTPMEAYIVMSPFVNMASHMDKFATLVDRHIQWHKALGFTRHILYLRAADILIFSEINAIKYWVKNHHLLLVLWELLPTPSYKAPYYDQRLVYNHAMLAFSNAPNPVWLANINLDEYIMSLKPDLHTFYDMAKCSESKGNPVSLQVPSYSAIRTKTVGGQEASTDIGWWVSKALNPETQHPILAYSTVSLSEPLGQAIYRPDFVHTIHSHIASIFEEYSHTVINDDGSSCMFLLHLKQLYKSEDLSDEFKLKDSLKKALKIRVERIPKIKRPINWLLNSVTNESDPWVIRRNKKKTAFQKLMVL